MYVIFSICFIIEGHITQLIFFTTDCAGSVYGSVHRIINSRVLLFGFLAAARTARTMFPDVRGLCIAISLDRFGLRPETI